MMRKPPSATPCGNKVGVKKGPWTPEEDEILANYIEREGIGRWRTLPKSAGLLRCGKSCRLRWMNYLRPSVKRGSIAPDEEDLILRLHRLLGNRWSLIAGRIPGRTDNEIKNYWNTHLSKKLISQGIDPRTHKPLDNYPNSSNNTAYLTNSTTNANFNPNPNQLSWMGEESSTNYVGAPAGESSMQINRNPNSSPKRIPNYPSMVDDHHEESSRNYGGAAADGSAEHLIQCGNQFVHVGNDSGWQNHDVGLIRTHGNNGEEVGLVSFDYGSNEDMFSSFLNSLMNEDLFTNQQQQAPLPMLPQPPYPMSYQPTSVQGFDQSSAWDVASTAPATATFSAGQLGQDFPQLN
ncbi:hypothetical protein Nepgr_010074 [Nepenthes gracilis]|uniref:Uncharacterized protein n=1 Tax=Nepenthes gracilis TaxID=150966 RepID=A0AAD3XKY8_NEPGR|nr:hypothetical protein Nepgr_010074 [Nepenthes gracilis]